MNTWLFIIGALFIQEPATMDAAIFVIREQHLNLWLINLLWVLATAIDITVGYAIGTWVQSASKGSRFAGWSERWAAKIEDFIGRRGERFAIILLGVINFPYLNALIVSWLKLSFRNIFILIFIGEAIYWGIAWAVNISVRNYVSDPHAALYIIVGIALLFSILSKAILNRISKNSSSRTEY